MTKCDGIRMRAPLYLSGEMQAEERETFADHLAQCPACAAKIAEDRELDAILGSVMEAFEPNTERLEQRLQQRLRLTIAAERRRRRWALAGATAAAILLGAAALAWAHWSKAPQWFIDAALDHRVEVVAGAPRHWRSNAVELAAITAKNGLTFAQATAMAAPGYKLERARICGIAGQRMLHMVFSNGTRSYSVFIAPQTGSLETVRTIRQGAERVAGFETGRFRGIVVAEESARECAELARAAEQQL